MKVKCSFLTILCWFAVLLYGCRNRNSNQLPVVKIPGKKISVNGISNGKKLVEFTFVQNFDSGKDTVWLSVTNTSGEGLKNFRFFVEMCSTLPKNFDSCFDTKQHNLDSIPANSTKEKVMYWLKSDFIDVSLLQTGIISYGLNEDDDFVSLYSSVYAAFVDTVQTQVNDSLIKVTFSSEYGQVNGYIMQDGSSLFRIKKGKDVYYNLEGLFLKDFGFSGTLSKENGPFIPAKNETLSDTSKSPYEITGNFLKFKVRLQEAKTDTIKTLLIYTKRI